MAEFFAIAPKSLVLACPALRLGLFTSGQAGLMATLLPPKPFKSLPELAALLSARGNPGPLLSLRAERGNPVVEGALRLDRHVAALLAMTAF